MTQLADIDTLLAQVRDEYLRRMTQGHGRLLQQVEHYTVAHTGKMLRPRLTLLAAATLGSDVLHSRRTLLLAVAVEMLHNASLLHDDVIDRSLTRRGTPSVNARWNNGIAVLVGDYHLAHLMQLLDEVSDADASRLINQTVIAMVEAELLQQEVESGKIKDESGKMKDEKGENKPASANFQHSTFNFQLPTKETYLAIIDGKTARLFATAAALGNPAYQHFGLHYGRLFQLRDDLADDEATPWTEQLIEQEVNILATMQEKLDISY